MIIRVCIRNMMKILHRDDQIVCVRNVNGLSHMVLKTLQEIKPYEEITYDYNFDSFNMEAQVSAHRFCGRRKCDGAQSYVNCSFKILLCGGLFCAGGCGTCAVTKVC